MNLWWCNQTREWKREFSAGVVCSSTDAAQLRFRRMVYDARKADIVLHYRSGRGVVAVSQAMTDAVVCIDRDERAICVHGEGWAFKTAYTKFDSPISIKNIRGALLDLNIPLGPLVGTVDNARVRQAYFMPFCKSGLEIIYRNSPDRNWPDYVTSLLDVDPSSVWKGPALASRVQENLLTEIRILARSRNRKLRDKAFERDKGICTVCQRDFNRILGGAGLRALHVHHLKQLASTDEPQETTVEDLVVVCANCHALIHLDPKKAMTVDELRIRLSTDGYLQNRQE